MSDEWIPPHSIYYGGDSVEEIDRPRLSPGTITFVESETKSPLDKQVGGGHYKHFKIQPVEFALENDLNFAQANAIKYICRYPFKDGIKDLKKAIHMLEMLIEFEQTKEKEDNE